MKRLTLLSCLFVLLLVVIPALALLEETPGSTEVQTNDQEKDSKVESLIKMSMEYFEAGKFEEALKQLNSALEKFPQKEYREKIKIEVAALHFLWAINLEKKYDYTNAIKHFEMAYTIEKNYRPKEAAIDLNNIGKVYNALGQITTFLNPWMKN